RRGIPRISRTMLSARLRELLDAGVIARHDGEQEPGHKLTAAGLELAVVVRELGTWGQRWLPRNLRNDDLDTDLLVWDMRRRIDSPWSSATTQEPIPTTAPARPPISPHLRSR